MSEGEVELVINSISELILPDADIADVDIDAKIAEEIESNITYFTNNKERMRYAEYRKLGYHIGSGAVESAYKHVVGQRLKQAGMRWSVKGADAILQLRILWITSYEYDLTAENEGRSYIKSTINTHQSGTNFRGHFKRRVFGFLKSQKYQQY